MLIFLIQSLRGIRLARVKVGGGWNERMLEKRKQDPASQPRMGGDGVSVPQTSTGGAES